MCGQSTQTLLSNMRNSSSFLWKVFWVLLGAFWYVGFLPFLFFSFSLSHALNVVCLRTCSYQAYIWFLFLVLDHKLINKKHGRCIYASDSFLLGDWSLERHFPVCKSVENMTCSHALILVFRLDDLVNQVLLFVIFYIKFLQISFFVCFFLFTFSCLFILLWALIEAGFHQNSNVIETVFAYI